MLMLTEACPEKCRPRKPSQECANECRSGKFTCRYDRMQPRTPQASTLSWVPSRIFTRLNYLYKQRNVSLTRDVPHPQYRSIWMLSISELHAPGQAYFPVSPCRFQPSGTWRRERQILKHRLPHPRDRGYDPACRTPGRSCQ